MTSLRRLCVGIFALACVEFVIATVGVQIQRLPSRTDFASYYLAGQMTRNGENPYDARALAERGHALGFEHDQYPFLYPPPFALAMQPLARLSYPRARQTWMLLTTGVLFAGVVLLLQLLRQQRALLGLESATYGWVVAAAFVAAALHSTGVHNDVRSGSVGIALFFLFTGLSLALMQRRGALAALALVLAIVAKLSPLALFPYLWWRGSRRAASIVLLLLVVVAAASIAHWGWSIWAQYFDDALRPILRSEISWSHNLSLDGYLSRLFISNEMVEAPWHAPWLKHVLLVALGGTIALLTLTVVARRQRHAAMLPMELGCVVLALLMLMKITWVHTLSAMLFVWPLVMQVIVRAAERGAAWATRAGVLACAGFFLSSAHLPLLWSERLRSGAWVVLTGVHLLGLALLWAVTRFVLQREDEVLPGPLAADLVHPRSTTTGAP